MRPSFFLLAFPFLLAAQPTLPNAAPMPTPEIQYLDAAGRPLAGAKLCTYAAGGSTPLATYTDSTAGTPNANPIVLDVNGRASVWVGPALYKFVLRTGGDATCTTGTVQWTQDNVTDATLYFVNYVKTAGTCTLITFTATGTGAVTRTCSSKLGDTLSLRDFGAVGNGTTDDYTALAAAIAAAAATSKELYIPAGTYIFGSQIVLPSNSWIRCEKGATLKLKDHAAFVEAGGAIAAILNTPGTTNIRFRGCIIDGNKANITGAGANDWSGTVWARDLQLAGTATTAAGTPEGFLVEDMEFKNATGEGFFLNGATGALVQKSTAHNNATVGFMVGRATPVVQGVYNSTFSDLISWDNESVNSAGSDGFFVAKTFGSTFADLVAYGSAATPLYGGFTGMKVVFSDNNAFSNLSMQHNAWQGIDIDNSNFNTFHGGNVSYNACTTIAGAGFGIQIRDSSGPSQHNVVSGFVLNANLVGFHLYGATTLLNDITNNVITGSLTSTAPLYGSGIVITGPQNHFVGNLIAGNANAGVYFDVGGSGDLNQFVANRIIGNAGWGIYGTLQPPKLILEWNDFLSTANTLGAVTGLTITSTSIYVDSTTGRPMIAGTASGEPVVLGDPAGIAYVAIEGAAGHERRLDFRTGTSLRWRIIADGRAESGANAGSDLRLENYDDTGTLINNPLLLVVRATGTALWTGTFAATQQISGLTLKQQSGTVTSAAVCFKVDGTLGYCSSAVGAGGTCTCN
jgi:hypothetical protein